MLDFTYNDILEYKCKIYQDRKENGNPEWVISRLLTEGLQISGPTSLSLCLAWSTFPVGRKLSIFARLLFIVNQMVKFNALTYLCI